MPSTTPGAETPPTLREIRAVTELRRWLTKQERGGASHVAIDAVRMILGKI